MSDFIARLWARVHSRTGLASSGELWPNPVAAVPKISGIVALRGGGERVGSVIPCVITDGIEQEFAVGRAPVFQRPTARDQFRGHLLHKLRREFRERLRVFAARPPAAFEGTGDPGFINESLNANYVLERFGEVRDSHLAQPSVRSVWNLFWQPFRGLADVPFRIYSGHIDPHSAVFEILLQFAWTGAIVLGGYALMTYAKSRIVVQGG